MESSVDDQERFNSSGPATRIMVFV